MVSIERYVLVNLAMNGLALGLVARARGRVKWGAVAFSAGFGAVYAVAMQLPAFALLRAWPLRMVLLMLMVLCAMRVEGMWDYAGAITHVGAGTALLAGAQMMAQEALRGPSDWALVLGGATGAWMLMLALRERRQRLERFEARVVLGVSGRRVRISASADFGVD